MEWGRLYANLPDDPRVQRAEADGAAGWLLVESMCYCTSAETGGFIPHTQIERFSGGSTKKRKIAALVREQVWLPVEGGYTLNPDLWTEERNLSDSAEKKREADRKRIAAKRIAAKAAQNGHESRDSSATSRATPDATDGATCSGDSRALEKRREDKPLTADVVSHPADRNARGRCDDDELISAVVSVVLERTERLLSDDDARAVAARALARANAKGLIVHHPARYVAAILANEPDLYASLLLDEPPPLGEILTSTPRPPHCGDRWCDQATRRCEDPETGADAGPCPRCSGSLPGQQEAS